MNDLVESDKVMSFMVALTVFVVLVRILYFDTNFGLVSSTEYYTPIHAPLWFESLVTIICLPLMTYSCVYEKITGKDNC